MTPTAYVAAVAAEVRAEMARQRRTRSDLATVLGITPATAARRLDGDTPFDTRELMQVAHWLGVEPRAFMPPPTSAVPA